MSGIYNDENKNKNTAATGSETTMQKFRIPYTVIA